MTAARALLPDHRDRLRQQPAGSPHALRGGRRRRHRPLAPDGRRRDALPDRDRRAFGQHRPAGGRRGPLAAGVRRREGGAVQGGRGRARSSPRTGSSGRPTRTTSGRPRRWSAGRMPTATSTSAPTRAGTARTRGSGTRPTSRRPPRGTICPNHPDVPLQWLTERNWFFRLSAYQERLERHYADHPDFVQPDYRRNEMLGFIRRRARGLLDQPRRRRLGDPVPDRRERRDRRSARTAAGTRRPARSTSGTTR